MNYIDNKWPLRLNSCYKSILRPFHILPVVELTTIFVFKVVIIVMYSLVQTRKFFSNRNLLLRLGLVALSNRSSNSNNNRSILISNMKNP
jgi:hypothetical protein